MRIGIYNATASGLGGAGQSVAVLAEGLNHLHRVDIISHNPSLTIKQLADYSGTSLESVQLRYTEQASNAFESHSNSQSLKQRLRDWSKILSEPYDIFITFTHGLPPFCHAPKGILMTLFPSPIPDRLHKIWREHLNSYQIQLANSRYTQIWAKHRWDIDCQIIYPPVDAHFCVTDKENKILSVGRFSGKGLSKKQLEMVKVFKQIARNQLKGWEYFSIGGLGDSPDSRVYFEKVRQEGEECQARVIANLERDVLKRVYEKSKIFWHAAGYAEETNLRPELAEHFGIVTVEAMGAGCIPLVINKGGQPEIIHHGVNGFLWNTLEELKEYTLLVSGDERLQSQMSEAARGHARHFSREDYISRFLQLLQSGKGMIGETAGSVCQTEKPMNMVKPASPAMPIGRYICMDITRFPIGGKKELIFSRGTRSVRIISSHLANLLERCRTFTPLDGLEVEYYNEVKRSQDKVQAMVSSLPAHLSPPFVTRLLSHLQKSQPHDQASSVPPDLAELIRNELLGLVEAGFLAPENKLIGKRGVDETANLTQEIASVGVVARNRDGLSSECLINHIENYKKYGRANSFVVVDGADNADVRRRTRQMLCSVKSQHNVPIFYAGLEEKAGFANKLVTHGDFPSEVVGFALFGSEKCGYSAGASRNALLLHAVDDLLFSSDYDTAGYFIAPGGSRKGLAIVSGDASTEYFFFPNREAAFQSTHLLEKNIITMHEQLLGKDLGACISTFCETEELSIAQMNSQLAHSLSSGLGKVLVTATGVLGRHSITSQNSSHHNFRGQASRPESHYLRAVHKTVINDGNLFVTQALGFDNRALLPPFFPISWPESGIFGAVLRSCFKNGYIGHLPGAVLHTPQEPHSHLPDSLFGIDYNLRLYDLMIACISSFQHLPGVIDERERLQALGRHLIEIGSLAMPDFEKYVCEQVWRLKVNYISCLESYLKKCEILPHFQANNVKALIDSIQKSLTQNEYIPPTDFLDTCDNDEARYQTQWSVRMFGQLLYWWPRIVESARDLRAQNERLAKEIT